MQRIMMPIPIRSFDVTGNTDGITTYYEQEKGNNQVKRGVSTAITSNIESGDFDITQDQKQGRHL